MNDFIDKFNSVPLAQKVVGLVIVAVAVAVGYLMVIHNPMTEEISDLETQATSLQREADRLEQIRENQAQVVARLEDLTAQLHVAREKLPEGAEIPSLLQRIHNQAQTAGLSINRFRRNEDISRTDFIEIPVDMDLTGSFDEVTNFFFFVGRMTRIVNIRQINIRRTGSGLTPDGELTVSAQATTYQWNPN